MKQIFNLLLLAVLLPATVLIAEENSATLKIGDKFPNQSYELPSEVKIDLSPETKYIIVSFEMELSKGIHTFLATKEPTYLKDHQTEYIADISKMPSIITFLFARPKMKSYKFPILLTKDPSFAPKFPILEGKFAVFELSQDRSVVDIRYFKDMETLSKVLFGEGSDSGENK